MKKIIPFIFLAISSLTSAGTINTAVSARASISPACQFSVSNISFGVYVPNQGDSFSTGNITIKCTRETTAQVGLSYAGTATSNASNNKYAASEGSGSYARFMSNGTDKLWYNLFRDSAHSQIFGGSNWFVATPNSRPIVVGNGQAQNVTIYAAMSSNQFVKAGNYSDTITASLTF